MGPRLIPPDTGLSLLIAFVIAVIGVILIVGPLPVGADYVGGLLCGGAAIVVVIGAAFAVLRRKP